MFVQLDAGQEDAVPVLTAVPGVTRVTAADAHGGFEVDSDRGTDVRRQLAREIVNRGWGLLELRPMRMSLEEIFLQVTTDEAAPATLDPEQVSVLDEHRQQGQAS
jgi:ABC-2 type transport system ATP-binding protein